MPFGLLANTILHSCLSYLPMLLLLKVLIAGEETLVRCGGLAAGAHSVLRFDVASGHHFLNVLLQGRLVVARAHILHGLLV